MAETIDATGLSCPQPVLLTLERIKAMGSGELVVEVDTEASRENVSRAAGQHGWQVRDTAVEDGVFRLTLARE